MEVLEYLSVPTRQGWRTCRAEVVLKGASSTDEGMPDVGAGVEEGAPVGSQPQQVAAVSPEENRKNEPAQQPVFLFFQQKEGESDLDAMQVDSVATSEVVAGVDTKRPEIEVTVDSRLSSDYFVVER